MKQFRNTILLSFLTLGLASMFTLAHPQASSALSGGQFQPGRIIDDAIFTNSGAMSVQDIQNFLYAKVSACDTWGNNQSPYWNANAGRYYTTGEYGSLKGNPPPFTCLRDFKENPDTHANNFNNPSASVSGSLTAAEIIWKAAQEYRINPQVLLATLQKEQGLVTDNWPWWIQYKHAMGYGCPDSAPCDSKYYGFYNQMMNAAWQFRYYLDHPNAFNYWIGQNYIQYNPNGGCGGSVVNIQNAATAALYIYTPYQPNSGALAQISDNGPGGSSDCGAYGNRNFWWYFNKWFGTSVTSDYTWEPYSQEAYQIDKTTPSALSGLPGEKHWAVLKVRNTGVVTWKRGLVNLGTWDPRDHGSMFSDGWISGNRAATLKEETVAPGEIGTFEFWLRHPDQGSRGVVRERFNMVAEGVSWMRDAGVYYTIQTNSPRYTWQPYNQTTFTDQNKSTYVDVKKLTPGQRVYHEIKALNTGNMPWKRGAVNLGTSAPQDRSSRFASGWQSNNRAATLKEEVVAPGQVGTFEFWAKAPISGGNYEEQFNLVAEGITWMNDHALRYNYRVEENNSWQVTSQQLYSDDSKSTPVNNNLYHGQMRFASIKIKNTSNFTWDRGAVNLATTEPRDRGSRFDRGWVSGNRPAYFKEARVEPGQTATFEFWIGAPHESGDFQERFSLVAEGSHWMDDIGMNIMFYVR